jgi:hypothetical protein
LQAALGGADTANGAYWAMTMSSRAPALPKPPIVVGRRIELDPDRWYKRIVTALSVSVMTVLAGYVVYLLLLTRH